MRPPRASLPAATRALCAFAAAMSRGDEPAAAAALATTRRARASRRAAEEAALMLMLYAGFPGALEGLRVLNATWPGRARATREGGLATWRRRGLELCRRVYGPAIARLLPAVRALHPDLEVWMVEHGYGRVLSRAGLGVRERELVTVSALAALGWERQLVSHVLGALRVGAPAAQVREALAIGEHAGGPRERAIAHRTWLRVENAQVRPAAAPGDVPPRARAGRR
jgi:alkylhydroperoxidase/carboxymuconolactone decarboxylase family protein YurZ